MRQGATQSGRAELAAAHRNCRSLLWVAFLFSVFVNLLMLTGPLYMLQVYDRVLSSRSEETLIALSLLVAFLYLMMATLDYARGRILARIGTRMRTKLDRRVFDAMLRKSARTPDGQGSKSGMRDLDALQALFSSPALLALFDLPWTPLFLAAIFVFHPWLGYLALAGGALLICLTILNQRLTKAPQQISGQNRQRAHELNDALIDQAETVRGLGMSRNGFEQWNGINTIALRGSLAKSDIAGTITAITKSLRLFLQSAMLGLGAFLVLQGQMTAGAMIAGSILLGRALAPIEATVGQWALVQRAHQAWQGLAKLLSEVGALPERTKLPTPAARLKAEQITIIPPGEQQATLRMLSFDLKPGEAMGVIGASGAGKTTLAKALTGVWPTAAGHIRLDGAALGQYDPDALGKYIGYLPQVITLFDGSLAQNIACLDADADPTKVIEAAKKAAAHELILRQPEGYDTPATVARNRLSGGEMQRLGLARALYDDPIILVLDEPNANLDNDGSNAMNEAIRAMKAEDKSVIIMAHRPSAIRECDTLLVIEGGIRRAFGPRDEVLRATVRNHARLSQKATSGGMT
ncbi:MAG: type I secretion system permease/ATPase [Pseudomonadota bacterium]